MITARNEDGGWDKRRKKGTKTDVTSTVSPATEFISSNRAPLGKLFKLRYCRGTRRITAFTSAGCYSEYKKKMTTRSIPRWPRVRLAYVHYTRAVSSIMRTDRAGGYRVFPLYGKYASPDRLPRRTRTYYQPDTTVCEHFPPNRFRSRRNVRPPVAERNTHFTLSRKHRAGRFPLRSYIAG